MTLLVLFACLSLYPADTGKAHATPHGEPASSKSGHLVDSARSRDFNAFWSAFRNAVIAGDTAGIISMTRFPVRVRGTLDFEMVKISRADFPRILAAFLQETCGTCTNYTRLDEIRNQKTIPNADIGEQWTSVSGLRFERIHGRWRLELAYVDTSTLESLGLYRSDEVLPGEP